MTFAPDEIETHMGQLGFQFDLQTVIAGNEFWYSNETVLGRLRELLTSLTTVARTEGNEGLQRWKRVYSIDLPVLLLHILSGDSQTPDLRVPPFRLNAMNRAIEILGEYDNMPENVETLCAMSNCSWDTLKRAFREEFGLSPKAYMKSRRLSAVQAELIKRGKGAVISEVANEWGFWHMGSFAADYRKKFGELPSETLHKLENRER